MKTLTLACLTLLFLTACTKEAAHLPPILSSKVVTLKVDFVTQSIENTASLTKGDSMTIGKWGGGNFNFEKTSASQAQASFITVGDDEDLSSPLGEIKFQCSLSGAAFDGQDYSGKGTWYISSANGNLSGINSGAGTLTYKESTYEDAEPTYEIDLSGMTKK